MLPVSDPVAIVTDGACGIGRELARGLADRGFAVVIVYLRDPGRAEAAVEQILASGGTAVSVRADVTDELDVERLFYETDAAFGAVDVVAHTAVGGANLVYRFAARTLRRSGAIFTGSEPISRDLAAELRARDITVDDMPPWWTGE
jgi:NAD(P)-dependent dehydrogenase (short-subunit alcohol dehydrogenase family)